MMPRQTTLSVRKPATIFLLLATTIGILFVTLSLTGKSYSKMDPVPFEDLRHLTHRIERKPVSTQILAVVVGPIIVNVLLFLPWGFLMFVALYNDERPTIQTYVLTLLLGFSFTCAIEAYQYFLPSRVADINDIIWNTVGTLLGAFLGHMRMRLRFEFE